MRPKTFLRTLTLIHTVLFLGMVAFGLFTYFQNGSFTARMNRKELLVYVVPFLAAVGYFLSQFLFTKQLQPLQREQKLSLKLSKYLSASLLKYSLLEVPGFLALSSYLVSGNALYLVIAIALMAYLFVQRPTADQIKKDLPLTMDEQKLFDNL